MWFDEIGRRNNDTAVITNDNKSNVIDLSNGHLLLDKWVDSIKKFYGFEIVNAHENGYSWFNILNTQTKKQLFAQWLLFLDNFYEFYWFAVNKQGKMNIFDLGNVGWVLDHWVDRIDYEKDNNFCTVTENGQQYVIQLRGKWHR